MRHRRVAGQQPPGSERVNTELQRKPTEVDLKADARPTVDLFNFLEQQLRAFVGDPGVGGLCEIGRASCRERVEISAVAVVLEEKDYRGLLALRALAPGEC